MDVFGIFIVVSFVCLILTLVIMNIVNKAKITQEYNPYSEYYWYQRSINEEQEKYLETVPSHKTRVALRKKRQRKK